MTPPGVDRRWDHNSETVQGYLISYNQIRQAEDIELAAEIAAASPRIQL